MILKSIREGIKFAFSLNAIAPYLVLNLIIFYILIGLFSNIISLIPGEISDLKVLFSMGIYLPALIIISLFYLWVTGAITDQARYYPKRKPLIKSFQYSTSRYLPILCATILSMILTGIISSMPIIGPILSFILSLMFFYLYPAIIVNKKGCMESFRKSFNTFMKYPLETFVTKLLLIVLSFIIISFFALSLLISVSSRLTDIPEINQLDVLSQSTIQNLFYAIADAIHSPYFVIYLIIASIGLAINSALQTGTQVRMYLNTKKVEA